MKPLHRLWDRLGQSGERLKLILLVYGIGATALLTFTQLRWAILPVPVGSEAFVTMAILALCVLLLTGYFWLRDRVGDDARWEALAHRRYWFAAKPDKRSARPVPVTWEGWAVFGTQTALVAVLVPFLILDGGAAWIPAYGFYSAFAFAYLSIPVLFLKTRPMGLKVGEDSLP